MSQVSQVWNENRYLLEPFAIVVTLIVL